MDEVKIWVIESDARAVPLEEKGHTDTEALLEETLVNNPDLLLPGLRVVGRQTPTASGPLDLLGVDSDGRLVVFELKRGTLTRDAVAQLMDYASALDSMDADELLEHISDRSGGRGIERIEDFQEWYESEDLESLKPLRMFLIGLGADDTTRRIVDFLSSNSNLDISLLTFHGFTHEGKTLLAKQVEVGSSDLEPVSKWDALRNRAVNFNASEMFDDVMQMFRMEWPEARQYAGSKGFSVRLRPSGRSKRRNYARIYVQRDGRVRIVFERRAFELAEDQVKEAVEVDKIPFETWPRRNQTEPLADDTRSVEFLLTAAEWSKHGERVRSVMQEVYGGWDSGGQEGDST